MTTTGNQRELLVFAHWAALDGPQFMGSLNADRLRGKEVFSFEYAPDWLRSNQARLLDPDLRFFEGRQYLSDESKPNFGLFTDSAPDRWGRVLMQRKEAAQARLEERSPHRLLETDYLLGVYDLARMGALRFKLEQDGPFLNDDERMAAPPWARLRTLEEVSLKLEDENAIDDPDYLQWINQLIAPGSSLGGARPKASVTDPDGQLWLAKFPSRKDDEDMGAWEFVVHQLAGEAGINVGEARLMKLTGKQHTFLAKRFDRTANGKRIHFASAMTLLGHTDGHSAADGASYLELASFIVRYGAEPQADLEEMWRRMLFSVCVSNTDDHLRNHGFLLSQKGWRLSPAYDINPNEQGSGLSLNIDQFDNSLSLELVRSVANYFRVSPARQEEIIADVLKAVRRWKVVAREQGIPAVEIELKQVAFQLAGEP